jgi:hypothetical protein
MELYSTEFKVADTGIKVGLIDLGFSGKGYSDLDTRNNFRDTSFSYR